MPDKRMQCRKCSVQQADQKLLARLAEQEAQDQHIQSARREKARADAAWMKKVNGLNPFIAENVFYVQCFDTLSLASGWVPGL